MKLTNVRNEQAVTRTLTYVRIIEMYTSLFDALIREDMVPPDAHNMITFKRWHTQCLDDSFPFTIQFALPNKRGQALWSAKCRISCDYYHVTIDDLSFKLTKQGMPETTVFGIDCRFGFLSFCAVPEASRASDMLAEYIEERDVLFKHMCIARELAEQHAAKVKELESKLETIAAVLNDESTSTQK